MYTVVGSARSRAFRVLWMLEELGEDYVHEPARPRSAEVRALNPRGRIPVLKDGDAVLTDSVAILTYLADRHGALAAPPGTHARARQDAMTQFAVADLDAPLWTRARHSFVLPEAERVAAVKPVCDAEVAAAFAELATLMEGAPFAAGDDFTIADILIGQCAGWAERAGVALPAAGPVADYLARIRARPALARAMARAAG